MDSAKRDEPFTVKFDRKNHRPDFRVWIHVVTAAKAPLRISLNVVSKYFPSALVTHAPSTPEFLHSCELSRSSRITKNLIENHRHPQEPTAARRLEEVGYATFGFRRCDKPNDTEENHDGDNILTCP